MPKWGLTVAQRAARPWRLDDRFLQPGKTITDPVHGDIHVTELERMIIDSPPMQRLRRVRQLGTTHLVYPAATHSRFSHALGTLRAAQDLLDAVADNRRGPRHTPDLFDEWEREGVLREDENGSITVADARTGEATILARLGALMHDLCHVPLGHTIEDDLKVLTPHDRNRARFDELWKGLDPAARNAIEKGQSGFEGAYSLKEELEMLILSKERSASGFSDSRRFDPTQSRYPFVGDIVGNTICADLIDYLQRDHLSTGLPIALGSRFMDDFYVMGSQHEHFKHRMVVRIARKGQAREDVKTELVKYLRYRYELTERVLTHHTKIAADAMIGKLLEIWSDAVWIEEAEAVYGRRLGRRSRDSDVDDFKQRVATIDPRQLGRRDAREASTNIPELSRSRAIVDIDERVRARLEASFTAQSDDGLLEYLGGLSECMGGERYEAVSELARAVLDRRLFKLIGVAAGAGDFALADEKYEKYGKAGIRRRLEREATRVAGVQPGWKVVIWLPNPDMRLKVAGVLVDDGRSVAPLDRVSPDGGRIGGQHQRLWAISIFAAPDVVENSQQALAALMSMKHQMDIDLVTRTGKTVPTMQEEAVRAVAEAARLGREAIDQLAEIAEEFEIAASGAQGSFAERLAVLWRTAREDGVPGIKGRPPRILWHS